MDVLAFVERSPAAVAAHDKAAWVGLFTESARLNDPVGSRPHVGTAAIERFYDTFIAPNVIRFDVRHDVVSGRTVFRDLTILTTMRSGLTLSVPMHLRYDVVAEGDELKIDYLAAHWELSAMIGQMMRSPILGTHTSITLGARLLRHQGMGGLLGFAGALRSVGRHGKKAATAFLDALAAGDQPEAIAALEPGAIVDLPTGIAGSAAPRQLSWSKLIAAGDTVTASLDVGGHPGVAQLDFERGSRRPTRVQVFTG